MKLYSVVADKFDYDEYDKFLIWAETAEQALKIAQQKAKGYWSGMSNFDSKAEVTEVSPPAEPGILLGSFNAG